MTWLYGWNGGGKECISSCDGEISLKSSLGGREGGDKYIILIHTSAV